MPSNIVILTGAGLSAESGVATFRDAGGVWAKYDYREVATPEGFAAKPELVQSFYNARRAQLAEVAPNAAHVALAQLEIAWSGQVTLVTQNVDDLHERAGSKQVIHMHGELRRALCTHCGQSMPWLDDITRDSVCPLCGETGGLRPDVVWFGEIPYCLDEIETALTGADMFVSIGTSGQVYPAAGFAAVARQMGAETVELNLEPSETAGGFMRSEHGPATQVVPAFVDEILN
ncbi:MAG: NAD-dependent deacylase [Pseudomonadota bacterium]